MLLVQYKMLEVGMDKELENIAQTQLEIEKLKKEEEAPVLEPPSDQ